MLETSNLVHRLATGVLTKKKSELGQKSRERVT